MLSFLLALPTLDLLENSCHLFLPASSSLRGLIFFVFGALSAVSAAASSAALEVWCSGYKLAAADMTPGVLEFGAPGGVSSREGVGGAEREGEAVESALRLVPTTVAGFAADEKEGAAVVGLALEETGRMSFARTVSVVSSILNLTAYMGAVEEPVMDVMRAGYQALSMDQRARTLSLTLYATGPAMAWSGSSAGPPGLRDRWFWW